MPYLTSFTTYIPLLTLCTSPPPSSPSHTNCYFHSVPPFLLTTHQAPMEEELFVTFFVYVSCLTFYFQLCVLCWLETTIKLKRFNVIHETFDFLSYQQFRVRMILYLFIPFCFFFLLLLLPLLFLLPFLLLSFSPRDLDVHHLN